MRSIKTIFGLLLILLVSFQDAHAARAHDIVEKTFVLKGEEAQRAAELFGIPPEVPARIELPWSHQSFARNCSWSQEKVEPPFIRCEDIKAPVNKIIYSIGSEPELKLEGYWMDESTGSGANFSRFSHGMNLPPTNERDRGGWEKIDKAFTEKVHLAKRGERGELVITTTEDTNPRIVLTRYRNNEDTNRSIFISVDFDTPTQHAEKQAKHKECLATNEDRDGGC